MEVGLCPPCYVENAAVRAELRGAVWWQSLAATSASRSSPPTRIGGRGAAPALPPVSGAEGQRSMGINGVFQGIFSLIQCSF